MANKIVKHDWHGNGIRQRTDDGFVNITDLTLPGLKTRGYQTSHTLLMCKAGGRRVGDFLDLPSTRDYIAALALDLGLLPENLVIKKRGRYGDSFAHPEIAIECARWVNMPFHIWANRTLRHIIERADIPSSRILEIPEPGTPVFESWFESQIARITKLHKNDIRNGKFYWEFVYAWLTDEERAELNRINPVLPNGRRRYKIHDCLTPETKKRLVPLQYKLMGKLESCNSVHELRRMVQRCEGVDQPNLFDGIWQSIGLIDSAS